MTGDARQFALEIDAEFAAMMGGVAKAVQFVGIEGLAMLQERSPVGNPALWKHPRPHVGGQFRANWLLSIGETDGRMFEGPSPEAASLSASAIASYPLTGDTFPAINLQNNLPYASRLEDGYSGQAPAGVVGVTVADLAALWESKTV